MSDKHVDEISGVETTGHEWDGIRELNNPMPRWWVYTFYATIVWAIGYMIVYPAVPLLTDATKGVLGYSSRAELSVELAECQGGAGRQSGKDRRELARPRSSPIRSFTSSQLPAGASAFKVNCAQCHGSGAAGSAGFPNLNDDDWLWGGKPEEIYQTVAHGIRYTGDDETRVSEMPSFAEILQAGRDQADGRLCRQPHRHAFGCGAWSNRARRCSRPIAPRATAPTPRAIASSARRILPMRSGSMAQASRRSSRR